MDEFERNEQAPENETQYEEKTTAQEDTNNMSNEAEAPDFYDKNIPGPTKYDRAQRTYADAIDRQESAPTPDRQIPAILALIFSIIALILGFVPIIGTIFGTGSAVTGIVLGAISIKGSKRGFSITAIVLSIIALVLVILITSLLVMLLVEAISEGIDTYPGRHFYYSFPY